MKTVYNVPCKCPVCGEVRYLKRKEPLNYCLIRRCRYCAKPKTIGKKYLARNGYIMIQTPDGWKYEHRFVWEQHYGSIPKGFIIHHKNHDKTDNRVENLELLLKKKHDAIESRKQWELRHNGILPYRKVPNQKDFDENLLKELLMKGLSIRQIAKMFNVSHGTIRRNIRDYGLSSFVSRKPPRRVNLTKDNLLVALKQTRSMVGAAKLLSVSFDTVKRYVKLYNITPLQRGEYKKQHVNKETLLTAINTNGSLRKAATALGIGRNVVRRLAKEYEIY